MLYTSKEVAEMFNITPRAVNERIKIKRIKPYTFAGGTLFLFDVEMIKAIKKKKEKLSNAILNDVGFDVKEIIYVTRTTEILHSKLNYLSLEQL